MRGGTVPGALELRPQLSDRAGMMMSPKALASADFGQKPVCSGPYKFVERVQNDRIVLERFKEHWNAKEYNFDRVVFTPIPDTTVRLAKRVSLEHVAETDALVARDLLSMTTTNLQHAEDHMLLLGRKTSLERVAAFLLEMDRRLCAADVMALPMSRRDIADYLGLTLETVSRALSSLHEKGFLDFLGQTQRQIVLRNRSELAKLDA